MRRRRRKSLLDRIAERYPPPREISDEPLSIASIDVGRTNFAYVIGTLETAGITITDAQVLDLGSLRHVRVPFADCQLRHSRSAADLVLHLLQERPEISSSEVVLIERQPLGGLQDIEQVLCALLGQAVLISPRTLHLFLGSGGYDYDGRKVISERYAAHALSRIQGYPEASRRHDMADAYCMLDMVCSAWRVIRPAPAPPPPDTLAFFDSFRYDHGTVEKNN